MKNVRWVCDRCGEKWIYPIEYCTKCKQATEKQVGSVFTVVACTKVMLATPSHPKVPYYIALLKDEHGNLLPQKVSRELEYGERYHEEKSGRKDAVALVYVPHDDNLAEADAKELLEADNLFTKKVVLGSLAFNEIIVASQSRESIDTMESYLRKATGKRPQVPVVGKDPDLVRS